MLISITDMPTLEGSNVAASQNGTATLRAGTKIKNALVMTVSVNRNSERLFRIASEDFDSNQCENHRSIRA